MSGNRQSRAWQLRTGSIAAGCFAVLLLGMPTAAKAQTAAADVAAQVRQQGYQCDGPVAARRDVKRSRRDSAVWILNCGNAAYRVRLDPDMAAHVTTLTRKR